MPQRSVNEKGWRRSRINSIGYDLIDGPRSLFPPEELDVRGWLEPDLRMVWSSLAYRKVESLAVFTDNTVNRDSGFLPAILRYVLWDHRSDVLELPLWPRVEISLSYFEEYRERVSTHIKALQTALGSAPFVPYGLAAERDDPYPDRPELNDFSPLGRLTLYSRHGWQEIKYSSEVMAGEPFSDLFLEVFNDLRAMLRPIPRQGWREVYNWDLNALSPQESWTWDGETPAPPE